MTKETFLHAFNLANELSVYVSGEWVAFLSNSSHNNPICLALSFKLFTSYRTVIKV